MTADNAVSACLIADLDSIRQATAAVDDATDYPRVIESIRLGRLLCDQIAMPTNQILDGYISLKLGPGGVSRLCGSDQGEPAVVALTRTGSLSKDLIGLLRRLGSFHWSCLDALGVGGGALRGLQVDLPEDVAVPDAMDLLREAADAHGTAARDAVDWLIHVWGPWLTAEADGTLQTRRWKEFTEVVIDPPAEWRLDDAMIDRWRATTDRSVIHADVVQLNASAEHKREIFEWWNDRYLQAIAEANDTFWLRVMSDETTSPTRRSDGSDRALRLTGNARAEIRAMPSSVFSWVVYKCSLVQRDWESQPDDRALRRVAHVVSRTVMPEDPYIARRSMAIRVALTVLIALTVVLLEASASHFAHGAGLTVLVLVLGGMAAVPYGELYQWWRDRQSEVTAIVRRGGAPL